VGRTVFRGPEGTAPAGTVAIFGPDGAPLPPGQIGEIAFAARQPVQYWRDPDVATDGWYRTGDLGRMDGEGRLYLEGRLNELLNRGGLKVSPGEIEAVLARHPAVADAAVVATADPVLGEAICACVVVAGAVVPSLGDVRSYLGQTLARHKLPDELCLVDSIPRTAIGKVERAALAASVAQDGRQRERLRPR
jgi:fatty-acyl-CoA synthase/2,3-dihydroxybenzoate-AMP ligase